MTITVILTDCGVTEQQNSDPLFISSTACLLATCESAHGLASGPTFVKVVYATE